MCELRRTFAGTDAAMTPAEIYDATRGWCRLDGDRAKRERYALAGDRHPGLLERRGLTELPRSWSPLCAAPTRFLAFPVSLSQRILDVAVLIAVDRVWPRLEGARQREAGLLHHAPRCDMDLHRRSQHPLNGELGEALADQRARPFGPVAVAPG